MANEKCHQLHLPIGRSNKADVSLEYFSPRCKYFSPANEHFSSMDKSMYFSPKDSSFCAKEEEQKILKETLLCEISNDTEFKTPLREFDDEDEEIFLQNGNIRSRTNGFTSTTNMTNESKETHQNRFEFSYLSPKPKRIQRSRCRRGRSKFHNTLVKIVKNMKELSSSSPGYSKTPTKHICLPRISLTKCFDTEINEQMEICIPNKMSEEYSTREPNNHALNAILAEKPLLSKVTKNHDVSLDNADKLIVSEAYFLLMASNKNRRMKKTD